ncbi:Spo0E family sporulation regulatory protein-aspartic acid phosphatase [Cytobacillus firmus]|uniref:aspartyl-phosphate phosphatase Spo0E family protein n=1 Tax=Bacillaceae TaxID=186817 RepID=UPI001A8E4D03|nr:aspartyl-phosphate phosphatase Spo0E family protein [Bacillus sp. NTK034]MBN8203915.1 aspartyl-phosphate phosphatase Spo0E family protein [Bacillus sp. NTK034]
MNDRDIQRKIEDKRAEMYLAANNLGLDSSKVVKISEELDHLINQFNSNRFLDRGSINISKNSV